MALGGEEEGIDMLVNEAFLFRSLNKLVFIEEVL